MNSSRNPVNLLNRVVIDLSTEEEEEEEEEGDEEDEEEEDKFLGTQHQVLDVLGDGTFGQVLKCYNLETETLEAVKVMKSRCDVIEMAKQEIKTLNWLRCLDPDRCHIVRFNSFFFNMEDICLSFELLDVDLHAYICETVPYQTGLRLPEVRHITQQLAKALHHLQTIGILHVDIKPGNVMVVDRHQKPLRVKLVDFGGSQLSGHVDFESFIFTEMYGSAEVLLQSEMNEAVDMWSLGVTAFELAVGSDLFPYRKCYSILKSIVNIFGQPPDRVLDKGLQTQHFFNKETNGEPRWTMKTADECGVAEKEDAFNCFSDVEEILSVHRGQETGLDLFVDLIKRMLHVDPSERITPLEALHHSFFTNKEDQADERDGSSNSAVEQLEDTEHVQPETAACQENPANVQAVTQVLMEDHAMKRNCLVDTLRSVRRGLALAAQTLPVFQFEGF